MLTSGTKLFRRLSEGLIHMIIAMCLLCISDLYLTFTNCFDTKTSCRPLIHSHQLTSHSTSLIVQMNTHTHTHTHTYTHIHTLTQERVQTHLTSKIHFAWFTHFTGIYRCRVLGSIPCLNLLFVFAKSGKSDVLLGKK